MEAGRRHPLAGRKQTAEHVAKRVRTGPAHGAWKELPSARSAHERIDRARGKASTYVCSCGRQARDWSYKLHEGYSVDPDDYTARCRSCHVAYDRRLAREAAW